MLILILTQLLISYSYCYKKLFSIYIKYYSKQGEKIVVLARILKSKSGFEDEVLIKLIVGVGIFNVYPFSKR
jgi:hypothetical protein